LSVQVPISEKDANKVELRNAILELSKQPGNEYLKEFVNRKDVDWQMVLLTQKDWDYRQQGLTGAGAAIIALIVIMATAGAGTAIVGAFGGSAATLGGSAVAMTQAAVVSLTTQASVSLINNGGDIGKTLNELGSKESVKGLAISVATAGALNAIGGTTMMQNIEKLKQSGDFVQKLAGNTAQALINSTISAGINTAVSGDSLSENLENYLASGAMTALQSTMAQYIKPLESQGFSVEYVLHKVAHAAAGCAAAAATKQSCEAGAIGAGVSEAMAEYLRQPKTFNTIDDALAYKDQIVEVSKAIAGAVAEITGYNSSTAVASADNALKNNFVFLAALPTAGEALVSFTLGAIRTCATNAACVSRAAQLGISVSATLAANSNNTDDKKVVKPVSISSSTGTPPSPDPDEKNKRANEKLEKGDKVDLSTFTKGKYEGQNVLIDSRTGYMIIRDRAGANSHGGSFWKLLNKSGKRIATLAENGKVLRG
jgi:filamentous hemagglutinin